MKFYNMTPHEINFYLADGTIETFSTAKDKDGKPLLARVGEIDIPSVERGLPSKYPLTCKEYSVPEIPVPPAGAEERVVVIVSGMVLSALKEQAATGHLPPVYDGEIFISPDTGTGAVRDASGKIIGTKRWVCLE